MRPQPGQQYYYIIITNHYQLRLLLLLILWSGFVLMCHLYVWVHHWSGWSVYVCVYMRILRLIKRKIWAQVWVLINLMVLCNSMLQSKEYTCIIIFIFYHLNSNLVRKIKKGRLTEFLFLICTKSMSCLKKTDAACSAVILMWTDIWSFFLIYEIYWRHCLK